MQRLSRFVLLAVLTLGGGVALTACQPAPGLAAQVGSVRLTDQQVEEIVTKIDDSLTARDRARIASEGTPSPGVTPSIPQGLPKDVFGNVRRRIVEFTVFNELARVYVADHGLTFTRPDYESASQQIGLDPVRHPDGTVEYNPYVVLYADTVTYRQLLASNAKQAEPTEADLQEAYRRAVAAGALDPSVSFEQVKGQLQQVEQIKTGVWLRDELAAVASRIGVAVSPRYRPIEVATGSVTGQSGEVALIALPLGESSAPVVVNAS